MFIIWLVLCVFPWVVSGCFFREVGAVFNVDSLPRVFKVLFEDLGLFGGH